MAELLAKEPKNFKEALKKYLSEGLSYPKSREKAIMQCLNVEHSNLVTSPNNILGIEYLKQLLLTNSSIEPITVQRIAADYHDTELSGHIASATAIRKWFSTKELDNVMPADSLKILKANEKDQNQDSILYKLICSKILTSSNKEI